MRNLSSDMLADLFATETDEAILALVTIDHDTLSTPIRVTSDAVETVSNGNTFQPFPFQYTFPDQSDENEATAKLKIDNVDRKITKAVRELSSAPTVTTQIVRGSDPDTIEASFPDFKLVNVSYDKHTVEGTLSLESLVSQPFGTHTFNPQYFPNLF